jgi:hypothetical protein
MAWFIGGTDVFYGNHETAESVNSGGQFREDLRPREDGERTSRVCSRQDARGDRSRYGQYTAGTLSEEGIGKVYQPPNALDGTWSANHCHSTSC